MRHGCTLLIVALGIGSPLGCRSIPDTDPRYRPPENLLEVVAVLRRHVPDDTYRFEPALDFTGRNVYRSTLMRLESIERMYEEALRAGHMDGVIAFAKGRALERLRAFDLAAAHYRRAAEVDAELRAEALRSAVLCEGLHEAASIGPNLGDPIHDAAASDVLALDSGAVLADYERRVSRLEGLLASDPAGDYQTVIREEIERADLARAMYVNSVRGLTPDGDVRAIAERQRVVTRHRDSKHANRHVLALAHLYAELAAEYVEAHPPESLLFDPTRFQELARAATRLYQSVANQDGTSEKLEASHRLEAFVAFTLRIDRDRFTP